jgi:hypothetical protein
VIHVNRKVLASRMLNDVFKSIYNANNSIANWVKHVNKELTEEETQMVNAFLKLYHLARN